MDYVFRIQYNEKYHGIRHRIIIGRNILKLPEINIHENGPSKYGPCTTTNTGGNDQYSNKNHCKMERQNKNIPSNRYEILLGQRQNTKKSFPHIMEKGEKI